MSSSFTLGDGDGPRPPTSPQSGSRAGAARPTDSGFDQLHYAHLLDVCAPVDDLHEQCVAATAGIRDGFNQAHDAVAAGAARFQADIDRIVAAGEQSGWDVVVDLAARGRA